MGSLRGKTCMITGASSGVGRAAAHALAQRGAALVLLCRDPRRGEETVAELRAQGHSPSVELLLCDLRSQAQVRSAAGTFLATDRPLHVLLNNAGVIERRRSVTEDGIETTFAVNHLSHFLLTSLLLDRLVRSAPARIVNVASDAHQGHALDFDDLGAERRYGIMKAYGCSKLANILFTRELARRLDGTGVTANALHPGFVGTRFATNNGWLGRAAMALLRPFARSPARGAETAVYLCASPEVEGVSGAYFFDCREHSPSPAAESDEDARRLWEISARLTGLAA